MDDIFVIRDILLNNQFDIVAEIIINRTIFIRDKKLSMSALIIIDIYANNTPKIIFKERNNDCWSIDFLFFIEKDKMEIRNANKKNMLVNSLYFNLSYRRAIKIVKYNDGIRMKFVFSAEIFMSLINVDYFLYS
ncbi:hypothetical protein AB7W17_19045 [Providencia rettgeri]